MPSNPYPLGLLHMTKEGVDNLTFRLALMSSAGTDYVYDSTHQYFDNGANDATDPSFCETGATDYVEKAAAATMQLDVANSRLELIIPDTTWTALGNGTNEIITAAILLDYTGDFTTSHLLIYLDLSNTITTNQNFPLDFDDNNGNLRIPYIIV